MGEGSGADPALPWLVSGESTEELAGEEGGLDEPLVCCESLGIKLVTYQPGGSNIRRQHVHTEHARSAQS